MPACARERALPPPLSPAHKPSPPPLPASRAPRPQPKAAKTKLKSKVCVVNATIPAADGVLDPTDMIAYLTKRIKVQKRAGNLGTSVTVEQDKKTPSHVVVTSTEPVALSKRYIKCAWRGAPPSTPLSPPPMRRGGPLLTAPPPLPPTCASRLLRPADLTKKYLKKNKLREYIRTVSSKNGYELRYFKIAGDGEAAEEDEEDDE